MSATGMSESKAETGLSSWWSEPCGGRDLLVLAVPLIISTASWTVMNFIDRMFLMWYSPDAMAASMPAGMLHFAMICFPMGLCRYLNTFVAQYHGAQRFNRIGTAIGQGIWVSIWFTPLFLLTIPLAPMIFSGAEHPPQVAALETTYFQIMTAGATATILATTLSAFFTGRGHTVVVMVVETIAAVVNIGLDWVWIFGKLGFPAWGMAGAAWATVAALWVKALIYLWLVYRPEFREMYGMGNLLKLDWPLMRRLWYFGAASGVQFLVDVTGFTLFILLIGSLGELALTTTTLAFNVNSVAFVPMLGLGMAVSTLVGQQQGGGNSRFAARATWNGFALAMLYSGIFAALYLFTPDFFLLGHAAGTDPQEFAPIRDVTVVLLRFVAAYCLFDATNIVFASAIAGAGDTRFVMLVSMLTAPLPVILGWWGVTYRNWGLIECWWIITAWISVLGVTYFFRFLQGKWKSMQVIEGESPVPLVGHPGAESIVAEHGEIRS